ncbi:hypothetical protein [Caviibacter abscessus]|uniref:hypothetical protein n=1 Tax=Caviibacter abscessus TaxID=1766719 RepID=UPI00082BC0AB|nr:hypothetical protein [Caviibacter abscessus]
MKEKNKGSSLIFAMILSFILAVITTTVIEYVIYKNKKTKIIQTKIDLKILRKRIIKKEKSQSKNNGYFDLSELNKEKLIYLSSGNKSIGGYHIENIFKNNEKIYPPLNFNENYEKILVIYKKEILGQLIKVSENIEFRIKGDIYIPYSNKIEFIEDSV